MELMGAQQASACGNSFRFRILVRRRLWWQRLAMEAHLQKPGFSRKAGLLWVPPLTAIPLLGRKHGWRPAGWLP
jgi:hypothetical protein